MFSELFKFKIVYEKHKILIVSKQNQLAITCNYKLHHNIV